MPKSFTTYGLGMKLGVESLVKSTAEEIVRDTIDSFKAIKTGRQYSTLINISSAPGETPAFQSGDLARSITTTFHSTPFGAEAEIRVNAEYAKYLVANGRPILSPAVNKQRFTFRDKILRLSNTLSGGIF